MSHGWDLKVATREGGSPKRAAGQRQEITPGCQVQYSTILMPRKRRWQEALVMDVVLGEIKQGKTEIRASRAGAGPEGEAWK